MKPFLNVMKALSDPSRVKIMKMLQHRDMCVCEIQTALESAQSTASKHLQILENAGLIISKKDGLWVNYSLADGRESPYAAILIGSLRHWLDSDPDIQSLLAKLPDINRENICRR
ncbi:MAG: metalloregulator ArsR/SmtB family transcription factor [Desulfobacteraceae bacterium]